MRKLKQESNPSAIAGNARTRMHEDFFIGLDNVESIGKLYKIDLILTSPDTRMWAARIPGRGLPGRGHIS
jgi:hypothetical protein